MSCGPTTSDDPEGGKNTTDYLKDQFNNGSDKSEDSYDIDGVFVPDVPQNVLPIEAAGDRNGEHYSSKKLSGRDKYSDISDPNLLRWLIWEDNISDLIKSNLDTACAFGRFQTLNIIGKMIKSGTRVFFRLVIDHLHDYNTTPQKGLSQVINEFKQNCLGIIQTDGAMSIFQHARECNLLSTPGKPALPTKTFGMSSLLETLYTRDIDKTAQAMFQTNSLKSNRMHFITTYFAYPLEIALSNKAVITSVFILMYYKYIVDIITYVQWDRFSSSHPIQSIVIEETQNLLMDLARPPFTSEQAFIREINISKEPTGSSTTPVIARPQPPEGGTCTTQ